MCAHQCVPILLANGHIRDEQRYATKEMTCMLFFLPLILILSPPPLLLLVVLVLAVVLLPLGCGRYCCFSNQLVLFAKNPFVIAISDNN